MEVGCTDAARASGQRPMTERAIEYQLRESPRARHVRLRVTLRGGLEIVVPKGFDLTRVPQVLERGDAWIRAARARAEHQRRTIPPESIWRIPPQIELPAVGVRWHVSARETRGPHVTVRTTGLDRLELAGRICEAQGCRAALARWLVRQAHTHLLPQLQAVSRQTGLRYARVSVRRQKTRWGSCSRVGAVSLNARLLFLPPPLVAYVLVHELCHTVELNHATAFWRLVQRHCPDYARRRIELRAAWRLVPLWASERHHPEMPG